MNDEKRLKRAALGWSSVTDTLMAGPPRCNASDIRKPQLRKSTFDLSTISWLECLGGGRDGYCWKVKFGDEGPFTLKLFWDQDRNEHTREFAAELECRNAALLQMMEAAAEEAKTTGEPIMVYANPQEWDDAMENMLFFSTEIRQNIDGIKEVAATFDMELRPIPRVPRLRKCYGWLLDNGKMLRTLPVPLFPPPVYVDHKLTRRLTRRDEAEYRAIVYEYIEPGENDLDTVQETVAFLHLVGFNFASIPLKRNWENNVLLDLSDIINPYQMYWNISDYKSGISAELIFKYDHGA